MNAVTVESISHRFVFHLVDHLCISMMRWIKLLGDFRWFWLTSLPQSQVMTETVLQKSHKGRSFCLFCQPHRGPRSSLPVPSLPSEGSRALTRAHGVQAVQASLGASGADRRAGQAPQTGATITGKWQGNQPPISKSRGWKFSSGSTHQLCNAPPSSSPLQSASEENTTTVAKLETTSRRWNGNNGACGVFMYCWQYPLSVNLRRNYGGVYCIIKKCSEQSDFYELFNRNTVFQTRTEMKWIPENILYLV